MLNELPVADIFVADRKQNQCPRTDFTFTPPRAAALRLANKSFIVFDGLMHGERIINKNRRSHMCRAEDDVTAVLCGVAMTTGYSERGGEKRHRYHAVERAIRAPGSSLTPVKKVKVGCVAERGTLVRAHRQAETCKHRTGYGSVSRSFTL